MTGGVQVIGAGTDLEVRGVSMNYDTPAGVVHALSDVSMKVETGRSLAIVGPSGCGKSTLLGLIGGLELPSAGQVRVGPDTVTVMSDKERAALRRRSFGFVFQSDNLQPFLTVDENVALQAVLAGVEDDPVPRRELLAVLEVAHLGYRFPDQLSGGERQRVAVARALIHHPTIVLADEPTGSLDVDNSRNVVDLLLRTHKQLGATLLVVTHDLAIAERMDGTVTMLDGRITGSTRGPS